MNLSVMSAGDGAGDGQADAVSAGLGIPGGVWGTPLLSRELTLMEIKCAGGIPMWMAGALSENHIYKASYSKYGTAYQAMIYPYLQGGRKYA